MTERAPGRGVRTSAPESATRLHLGTIVILILIVTLVPTLGATAAGNADDAEAVIAINVPVDTVVRGHAGSSVSLYTQPTPESLIGTSCAVDAVSVNQASVHPDNDIVVGDLVLPDVESEPFGSVSAEGSAVLGETIQVVVILGADEVFSAGVDVTFDCGLGSSTTSSSAPTTSEDSTTTTSESTTSSEVTGTVVTSTSIPAGSTTAVVSTAVTTTLPTEIIGTEVLPFTGLPAAGFGALGLATAAAGILALMAIHAVSGRRLAPVLPLIRPRCAHCAEDAAYKTPHGRMCRAHTKEALDSDLDLWLPERIR